MQTGGMKRVIPEQEFQVPTVTHIERGKLIDRAINIFGEDFLGRKALYIMEEKCKAAGIDIGFETLPVTGFHYREKDMDQVEKDIQKGKTRLLILRPGSMILNGQKSPITLRNLRNLFAEKNPFGDGNVFFSGKEYDNRDSFINESLVSRYAMPTKEVLQNSLDIDWHKQELLLEPRERRRTAVETAWDLILYYAVTGKRLLDGTYDWGQSQSLNFNYVCVGDFDTHGFGINVFIPSAAHDFKVGVCPSK